MRKYLSHFQKGILVALINLICVISLSAQTWSSPTITGSVLTTGTTYYVYNIGSNGYLTRGGNYLTQAVVSAWPRLNASASIIQWTATNTTASIWTFQYNLAGSNVANNFLFPANVSSADGSVYTDNTTNDTWNVVQTDATKNIYSIQVIDTYAGYVSTQYLGTASTTETTNKGIANTVRYNRANGDSYTQWKFVSQADLDLYNSRVLLDKYMTYGKNKGMDVSSYVSIYNAGVTADINSAAATLLTSLGRIDVTSSIINASFEDATYPTGWTNSGSFAKQTNVPNMNWVKDGTNYSEKYISNTATNYLAAGTITQTISGLSNGMYGLVVSGHAVKQFGANPLHTGAFVTAGALATEVSGGSDYFVDNIAVADGTLTIGYKLQAPVACNWTGFDNFRLYYYGPLAVPAITCSKAQFSFDGDTNYVSDSLTVSGLNLTGNISISAPAGITVSPSTLPSGASGTKVYVTYNGSSTVNGNLTFTSGSTTTNVSVAAASSIGCFSPLHTSGNLIVNPYMNSLTSFGGWGSKSINTDPAYVFCGTSCARITGKCGGSIDYNLTSLIKPNRSYRVKAMVNTNGTGTAKIGIAGATAVNILEEKSTAASEWLPVDFTFVAQNTITSANMYFNSCEAQTATVGYIDNWEMYQIPAVAVAESSVAAMATNVGSTDSKTITVSGNGLSGAIALALSGTNADQFSLSSASLPLAADSVASTVVTITYTPTASSLSHVATLTISSAGATDKVFTLSASAGNTAVNSREIANWNASVVDNKLKVTGVESYEVYSVQGLKVALVTANSLSKSVILNQGVYVVKTNQGVQKIIVK